MFWVLLALFAANFVLQAVLAAKSPNAKSDQTKPPRSVEGEPIPVVFGVQKVAPNATWFGNVDPQPIRRATGLFHKSTVGYSYYAGMQGVLCHGPVNQIVDVVFDNTRYVSQSPAQAQFTGTMSGLSPVYTVVPPAVPAFPLATTGADKTQVHLNLPNLYGGPENGNGGGVIGDIDFYFGTDAQTPNDYLASADALNEAVSAFKNVCFFVARKIYWGTTAQLKAMHVIVARFPSGANGTGTATVAGDANPAECIYDILTAPSTRYGLGIAPASIDLSSFQSCASTFFTEGLGISFTMDGSQSGKDTILDIAKHIDCEVYTHPTSGLITMALIRGDYDSSLGAVVELTGANATNISLTRPLPHEAITEMKVTYVNRALDYSQRAESAQNPAVFADTSIGNVETIDLPFLSHPTTALGAAFRLLKAKSLPLAKVSLDTNRAAFGFARAGVFALTCPEQGISRTIFRVMNVDYGRLEQGQMHVEAVEDVFSITGITLVPSGGSADTGTQTPGGTARADVIVEPNVSQTATVGSLELMIDDPNSRVTSVSFQSRTGTTAGGGYVVKPSSPWTASVNLTDGVNSYIDYDVAYTDVDGTTQHIQATITYPPTARPLRPVIVVTFDASGNATVAAHGDAITANIKLAWSTSALPSDATVRSATALTGTDVSTAGPVGMTPGQTLYVGAFGYAADGTESVRANLAAPYVAASAMPLQPITVDDETAALPGSRQLVAGEATAIDTSTPGQIAVDVAIPYGYSFGFGNGLGALVANQSVSDEVEEDGDITAWRFWTEDGVDVSASVDIQVSNGANPPVWTSLVGAGAKPNLSGARWAQATSISGWTGVHITAGQLLRAVLVLVDGTVKTARGFLSVTRT